MQLTSTSTTLYVSFFVGVLAAALLFAYIIVNNFTSNDLLNQPNIYRNGKVQKLCEVRNCNE